MNETPTPPPGFRIIPRAYLEAGNPLPEDALVSIDDSRWRVSLRAGRLAKPKDDGFRYATAQPLPCFQSPDQGPEHNPDGLTPEQYGAPEWRLLRKDEDPIASDEVVAPDKNFWITLAPNFVPGKRDNFTYRRRVAPEPAAPTVHPDTVARFAEIDAAEKRIAELERELTIERSESAETSRILHEQDEDVKRLTLERDEARKEAADLRNSNANANVHVKMVEKERDEARAEACPNCRSLDIRDDSSEDRPETHGLRYCNACGWQITARETTEKLALKIASANYIKLADTDARRADAEEAISHAYYLIVGESPKWSKEFGYAEALGQIDETQKVLRAQLAASEKDRDALKLGVITAIDIATGHAEPMPSLYRVEEHLRAILDAAMKEAK